MSDQVKSALKSGVALALAAGLVNCRRSAGSGWRGRGRFRGRPDWAAPLSASSRAAPLLPLRHRRRPHRRQAIMRRPMRAAIRRPRRRAAGMSRSKFGTATPTPMSSGASGSANKSTDSVL